MSRKTRRDYTTQALAIRDALAAILCGRFEWTGLPERLTTYQMERFISLWSANGLAVGFSDRTGGNMILPGYPSGEFDIYWLPRSYTVTGANFDKIIDSDDCVPFYATPARVGMLSLFESTADSLTTILSVMATNLRQQRNPYVFAGSKPEIETFREALRKREEGDEVLAVTQSGLSTVETAKRFFPIKPEFLGAQLMEHYTQVLNRFLTECGIDNVPVMKRERVTTSETESNNQLIIYYRDAATRIREDAANRYNKMFGASLNVTWRGGEIANEISETVRPGQPGV